MTEPFPSVTLTLVGVNVLVYFVLPIAFGSRFPYRRETLGVLWGPLVLHGYEWWRILTYSFVHFELSHLVPNMLGLWVLGTRTERALGGRTFLLFYLACGIVVGLAVLALHPFTAVIGASGAITGLAGGAIAIYAPRFKSLSWKPRAKLGVLILFAIGLIATEVTRGGYTSLIPQDCWRVGFLAAFSFTWRGQRAADVGRSAL